MWVIYVLVNWDQKFELNLMPFFIKFAVKIIFGKSHRLPEII